MKSHDRNLGFGRARTLNDRRCAAGGIGLDVRGADGTGYEVRDGVGSIDAGSRRGSSATKYAVQDGVGSTEGGSPGGPDGAGYDVRDGVGSVEAGSRRGHSGNEFDVRGTDVVTEFAVVETWLGRLLVGRSGRGLCAALFGDDDARLVDELRARFPSVAMRAGGVDMRALATEVAAHVTSPGRRSDLVLDPQGTEFQRRIWVALREIPAGQTVSYGGLAESIGSPGAARAVAGACAANPLAVLIPCHRVVRGDGTLSGYRWGVERKRALLAREAAV